MNKVDVVFDIEANGLLPAVDTIHIVVVRQIGTNYVKRFFDADSLKKAIPRFNKVVGHSITAYDLPALRKVWSIPFTVGAKADTWDGHEVEFIDTLHLSQLLNPDRANGHSLEAFSKLFGGREKVGREITDWSVYTELMGERCVNDTLLNEETYHYLLKEASERLSNGNTLAV